jgi:hypothetical protein
MSVLNSRVFAGVAGDHDSMSNDVPQYDDTHDVIWKAAEASVTAREYGETAQTTIPEGTTTIPTATGPKGRVHAGQHRVASVTPLQAAKQDPARLAAWRKTKLWLSSHLKQIRLTISASKRAI